jgi:hypothetical protein
MILSNFAEYKETVGIDGTITINLPSEITERAHVFIGIAFDATPGAGTITSVKAKTLNSPDAFQSIQNGASIDATGVVPTLSVAGNLTALEIVITGITTAAAMYVKVTANMN